ncbi:phage regulatory CII family protein [Inquilinus sp. CA228]|uniref:phage regulatory CII family protein n=1 Tax=Inquilinus sp. CA228 TaxID=3455609 RepID=UPI003F8D0805
MTAPRTMLGETTLRMMASLGEAGVIGATGKTIDALRKASNPNEGRRLGVDDVVRLAAACEVAGHGHDLVETIVALVRAEAAAMGGPMQVQPLGPDAHLRRIGAELGDLNRAVDDATADGRLTGGEMKRICDELGDVIGRAAAMRAELSRGGFAVKEG